MGIEERTDLIEIVISDRHDAIKNLEKYVRNHPRDADSHCILAAEYSLDYNKKAREECKIALKLNLNSADAYFCLGQVFHSGVNKPAEFKRHIGIEESDEGCLEKSIKYYNKALEINPKHKPAIYSLGWVNLEKGNFDEAIERFKFITSNVVDII